MRTSADTRGQGHVDGYLFTEDIDVSSVLTPGELAALLRVVHIRADRPSLRALEAKARHYRTPLSKTVASEMLKGTRFPPQGGHAVFPARMRGCRGSDGTVAARLGTGSGKRAGHVISPAARST
jgi:hypothetical protein